MNADLSVREKKVLKLLGIGSTRAEICEQLKISRANLRVIFYRLKAKSMMRLDEEQWEC